MALEDVLRRLADADTGRNSWDLGTNPVVSRVDAWTLERYDTRSEAFQAAESLLSELLAEGFRVGAHLELGASMEELDSLEAGRDDKWQGFLHVVLRDDSRPPILEED